MIARTAPGAGVRSVPYERLLGVSFLALLTAQFLGAVNDSVFRFVVPKALESLFGKDAPLAVTLPATCFILPWILLAPLAGWANDRFPKQRVYLASKSAELVCMLAIVFALLAQSPAAMGVAGFCMAAQFAICNPSKFGSIPDIVRPERISAANAALGLTTMTAMIVGFGFAGKLFEITFPNLKSAVDPLGNPRWEVMAGVFVAISTVGLAATWLIRPRPAADPKAELSWNLFRTLGNDLAVLRDNRKLAAVVATYAFYWGAGTLVQLTVFRYGSEVMNLTEAEQSPLLGLLALGAGLGSVMAGLLSAGIIELGLVPIGGILFSAATLALALPYQNKYLTEAILLLTGFAGGMVNVPLYSYIQFRSPPDKRGGVLAANNFVTFCGMFAATLTFHFLLAPKELAFNSRALFLVVGMVSLPVALWGLYRRHILVVRVIIGSTLRSFYKVRAYGRDDLPEGGALFVSNHISWLDGLLIGITAPKPVRMIAYAQYVESRSVRWFSRITGIIPIAPGSRAAVAAIRQAREAVRNGEYVCIFAEGCLSRTGQLLQFMPGLVKIVKDTDAPVIPIYLHGLWGSIFSYSEGRFFWKRPGGWRGAVGVHYGDALYDVSDVAPVRRAVEELGMQADEQRKSKSMILTRRMLRECRRSKRTFKAADTTGMELTGGTLLLRTLIAKRILEREILAADEKFVGVLLPPSVGGVIANTALAVGRRVSVNLNYTVTADVMNACIRQAGIRHVLTSRKVMQKLNMKLDAELVYLEDLRDKVTLADKAIAAFQAFAMPVGLLERSLGLTSVSPDDILTVIFTSGSTGEPKGVMLSYDNVGSNVTAIDQVVHLTPNDVMVGILPFFHSFGYTVTLWTVLTLTIRGIYHFSPLDVRQIGEMCGKYGATILMSTPTFLRSYLRRCSKEEFAKLDVVVTGAEKLPMDLADAFEKQFGVRPVEGYGCTELSPLVSVNVPPSRAPKQDQAVTKEGTVGRPVPGVAAKITDLDSGAELSAEQPGMLWIKGPNVMLGYLHHPEKTAQVVRDGWYQTGDVALLDKDGFIKITGRESRFSKIGGEMVPHIKIEELLTQLIDAGGEDELKLAVTAVPDPRKGERIVVLHKALAKKPDALVKEMQQAGVPNLWIPGVDSFLEVEQIPVLGTGKLDLRGLKQLAVSKFGDGVAAAGS